MPYGHGLKDMPWEPETGKTNKQTKKLSEFFGFVFS